LVLNFPGSRTIRNNFFVYTLPTLWYSFIAILKRPREILTQFSWMLKAHVITLTQPASFLLFCSMCGFFGLPSAN
jgi:hypothetical protein